MLYMHQRNVWQSNKTGVIGRWENVRKEGTKLLADAVFDESDKFAAKLKTKVENGFIRMASIGARIIENSEDKKHILPGQSRATVTKCELKEVSLVDIGGNSNALKLYGNDGEELQLSNALPEIKLNELNTNNMSNLKTIALALKLEASADESAILDAITSLKNKETQLAARIEQEGTAQKAEALTLVDKAVEKGILPETLKEAQLAAFETDFEGNKAKLSALLEAKKEPEGDAQLGEFLETLDSKGGEAGKVVKNYAWYQENDPKGLTKLQAKNPKQFAKLLDEHLKDE